MNPSNKARTRKRYAFSGMYSMRRSLSWNGCGIKVLRSGAAHKWLQLHLRLTEHKSCVVVAEWGKLATTRMSMVLFSRFFAWQNALVNVKPETFLSWHRKGFRLLWRWKSRRGRPRVPTDLRELIFKMAQENPTWGEERIAAELLLKLGIRVSPRTVRRYMPPDSGPRKRVPSQRWMTFVRNHARGMLASDFLVVVTAHFRVLYVFVVMEVGTRKIVHFNVTDHPTAD